MVRKRPTAVGRRTDDRAPLGALLQAALVVSCHVAPYPPRRHAARQPVIAVALHEALATAPPRVHYSVRITCEDVRHAGPRVFRYTSGTGSVQDEHGELQIPWPDECVSESAHLELMARVPGRPSCTAQFEGAVARSDPRLLCEVVCGGPPPARADGDALSLALEEIRACAQNFDRFAAGDRDGRLEVPDFNPESLTARLRTFYPHFPPEAPDPAGSSDAGARGVTDRSADERAVTGEPERCPAASVEPTACTTPPGPIPPGSEGRACAETARAWFALRWMCRRVVALEEDALTNPEDRSVGRVRCPERPEDVVEEPLLRLRAWLRNHDVLARETFLAQRGTVVGDSLALGVEGLSTPSAESHAPQSMTSHVLRHLVIHPGSTGALRPPPVLGGIGFRRPFPYDRTHGSASLFLQLLNQVVLRGNEVVHSNRRADVTITGLMGMSLHDSLVPCAAPHLGWESAVTPFLEQFAPLCAAYPLSPDVRRRYQADERCASDSLACLAARELFHRARGGPRGSFLVYALGSNDLLAWRHTLLNTPERTPEDFQRDLVELDDSTRFLDELGVRRVYIAPPDVTEVFQRVDSALAPAPRYTDGGAVPEGACLLPAWHAAAREGRRLPRHVVIPPDTCEALRNLTFDYHRAIRETLAIRSNWLVLDTLLEVPLLIDQLRREEPELASHRPFDFLSEDGEHPNALGYLVWSEALVQALVNAGVEVERLVPGGERPPSQSPYDDVYGFPRIPPDSRPALLDGIRRRLRERPDDDRGAYALQQLRREFGLILERVRYHRARDPQMYRPTAVTARHHQFARAMFQSIGAGEAHYDRGRGVIGMAPIEMRLRPSVAVFGASLGSSDGWGLGLRVGLGLFSVRAGDLVPVNDSPSARRTVWSPMAPLLPFLTMPMSYARATFLRVRAEADVRLVEDSAANGLRQAPNWSLGLLVTPLHVRYYFDRARELTVTVPGLAFAAWAPRVLSDRGPELARVAFWLRLGWQPGGSDPAFDVNPRAGLSLFLEPRVAVDLAHLSRGVSFDLAAGAALDFDVLPRNVFR